MKIPTNMWAACVEVRQQGAKGLFYEKHYVVRAEERNVDCYVLDDVEADGLEPRNILWKGRIV